jgi:hypothetical protein
MRMLDFACGFIVAVVLVGIVAGLVFKKKKALAPVDLPGGPKKPTVSASLLSLVTAAESTLRTLSW